MIFRLISREKNEAYGENFLGIVRGFRANVGRASMHADVDSHHLLEAGVFGRVGHWRSNQTKYGALQHTMGRRDQVAPVYECGATCMRQRAFGTEKGERSYPRPRMWNLD